MAETTRVWVRTPTLDSIVYGKIRSTNKRSIPGASKDESGDELRNWGWARGELVDSSAASDGCIGEDIKEIKVFIQDEESAHNRTEVVLPGSVVKEGNLVMANIYGNGDEDSEDEEDDYYDDYGMGGGDSFGDTAAGSQYPHDLITLTHLHEPAVVYCLRKRYSYDKIYTSTGPILLALNPFKNCKSLYSDTIMKKYWLRGEKHTNGNVTASSSSDREEEKKSDGPSRSSVVDEEDDSLAPHVYGTADNAFRSMMTKLEELKDAAAGGGRRRGASAANKGSDQAILVSGESGAGKTVTTKFIMQYLATLSTRSSSSKSSGKNASRRPSVNTATGEKVNIEQQVLQSNPILESFGNARTIRNDNSSRFGKFIEIQFTATGSLVGASIETYLLEKVRLITQADGERNYHIFYEILQGMEDEDLDRYFLSDYTAEDFKMTNQSGTYDRRDGVSDFETYQDLMNAMQTMGFSLSEQTDIMTVTCALLHASNLEFSSISADECEIDRGNSHLEPVLALIGVTAEALNRAMCYFSIQAGREKHIRSLSKEKSEKGLLAFIKAAYGALFTHIVQRVNESITLKDNASKRGGMRGDGNNGKASSIGVLDIFGFESFQSNSFEQLCINYCNEALQQQFNLFVLKNEQEEYEREGIQWSFIAFPENQDVLDLIDKKGAGILNILDDQCRAPGTTDKTFANYLYQKLSGNSRFQADFRQVGARKFAVVHYAGTVEYDSDGFVEKNRDELPKEATELLLSSSNVFVKKIASILDGSQASGDCAPNGGGRKGRSSSNKLTVGGQFSRQLQELRQKIDLTSPHYVRCLKPNDELVPDLFNPVIVADQLRCAGVVEAVRVSRLGYPQRYSHSLFVARYRILGMKALKKSARLSRRQKPVEVLVYAIAEKIVSTDPSKYIVGDLQKENNKSNSANANIDLVSVGIQVGKTKVFLRRTAYEILERLRNHKMRDAAVKIQSMGRRFIELQNYQRSQSAILTVQSCTRRMIAKKKVHELRRQRNATLIQTSFRKSKAQKRYIAVIHVCLWLQKHYRGHTGRFLYESLNKERKSILLQKYWRCHHLKKIYQSKKNAAILIQCAIRCFFARSVYKDLKASARDLHATAEERDNLRKETQELRKRLNDALAKVSSLQSNPHKNEEKKEIEEKNRELESLHVELEKAHDQMKKETSRADQALILSTEKSTEIASLRKEIDGFHVTINDFKQISETKESHLSKAQEELEKVKNELQVAKDLNAELSENMARTKEEVQTMRQESIELKEALDITRADLSLAKEEMHTLKSTATQQDSSNLLTAADLDEVREANANLKGTVVKLEDELKTKVEESLDSERKIEILSKKLDEMQKENDTLKKESEEQRTYNKEYEEIEKEAALEIDKVMNDVRNTMTQDQNPTLATALSMEGTQSICDGQQEEKAAQVTMLRDEVERLKEELGNAKSENEAIASDDLQEEIDRLKKEIVEAKESAAEEILTLQDEVQCLNNELSVAKQPNGHFPNSMNPSSQQHSQLGRLIDSIMEKDNEIRELRREISILKDQLDAATSRSSISRYDDDDERSVVTKLFSRPSRPLAVIRSTNQSPEYLDHPDKLEFEALKKINEVLRKEVEEARKECDTYKMKLREERERADKELEAFAGALEGVDELRMAAESMSREITKMKEENERSSRNKALNDVDRDDFDAVKAISQMEKANKLIDSSALRSEEMNVWSKVSSGIRSFRNDQGEKYGTVQQRKQSSSRRRRKRRGSNESLFSSFF